jgi:NitT/TauT family transport system ATP-binding protein
LRPDNSASEEVLCPLIAKIVEAECAERPRPVLEVRGVRFSFDSRTPVLDRISLLLHAGEIVAVVGPSGCGKSTLLRLIAGLATPREGSIEVAEPTESRHPCAMVFQEDTLLPWLRVRDNVSLARKFRGRRQVGSDLPIDELLELVGLKEFSHRYPYQLSGGMKRRLAVVVALASLPQLLLLDEPFAALDEPTRIGIHAEVYALLRRYNVATILVTHDLGEALSMSDRVVLLSNRPARASNEYTVPFGPDRNMMELRSRPEFLRLYGVIWRELSAFIKAISPTRNEPRDRRGERS